MKTVCARETFERIQVAELLAEQLGKTSVSVKNDGGLEFQDTSDDSDDSALDNVL